ncbi:MAG: hypothetical protein KAK00_09990 [Nanoarchaeota archaeon]|nr:hypothetical protein [Nanoarchaeota archaeon]
MIQELKHNFGVRKILGSVEINTIIKRMEGKPLKQTERNYLSRSIRPKLLAAKLLTEEKLLERIYRPDRSLQRKIIYNLDRYGYELITAKQIKKQKVIPIEELIGIIIVKQPKPRFIEAIPIILLKNKIDEFKLVEIASEYNIKNELGYLIEIAAMIIRKLGIKKDLSKLLKYFEKNKDEKIIFLGEEKDELYKEFLLKTSPKRIKKWNLLGRFFDEDFIKNARVYI